jgi:hypothetical protein
MPRAKKQPLVQPSPADITLGNLAAIRSQLGCTVAEALEVYKELKLEAKRTESPEQPHGYPVP